MHLGWCSADVCQNAIAHGSRRSNDYADRGAIMLTLRLHINAEHERVCQLATDFRAV